MVYMAEALHEMATLFPNPSSFLALAEIERDFLTENYNINYEVCPYAIVTSNHAQDG